VADQGASQRRGSQNTTNTPIGEGSTLFPKSSSSESLPQQSFGPASGLEEGSSNYRNYYDPLITNIGTAGVFEDPNGAKSRSQRQLGFANTFHDQPPQVYYKLVAYDSVSTNVATRWVSNQVSLSNAPASNGPGVLVLATLAVEASWTQ